MSGKFLFVLTIVVVIATITFNEAEACKTCGYDLCDCLGPAPMSYIPAAHHLPSPLFTCDSCGHNFHNPAPWLPRSHCSPCLKKKHLRLMNNCGCPSPCY